MYNSWLKWGDDDDEVVFKEKSEDMQGINNKLHQNETRIDSQHMSLSGTADSGTDSHHSLEGPGRG